jgi:hypothetical protein
MNFFVMHTIRGALATAIGALLLASAGPSHAQAQVREADNPARQPFQNEVQQVLTIPVPGGRPAQIQVADVPAGKRLVIEHISFRVVSLEATTPGTRQPRFQVFASLVTKANEVAASHEILVARTDLGTASSNAASQPIRAYADPGSQVFVRIGGDTEGESRSSFPVRVTNLAISGHLVNLP